MDGDGNVVVTGNYSDYYTAKFSSADGALLWEQRYNGPANGSDRARAIAVDASGNVIVTGSSFNGLNDDYYTAKYASADGALLWEQRYSGQPNSWDYDIAHAVALDGDGNVVVTGSSSGRGSASDYYTAKYAATDGALLWEQRYNSPANKFDSAAAVAVDNNGNAVVTGHSWDGNHENYYTAKYAAGDGTLLWEKGYDGPANNGDLAEAVAMDGSGNVVVTGFSHGRRDFFDFNYYTVKYASADGALLWEQRYNGTPDNVDYARALAVDGSGNVVVTGESVGSGGSGFDYYTAKYAAADGALLWEQRYDGPFNSEEYARGMAVDPRGDVVVTGDSYDGNYSDYATVKYAAADGRLLWAQRYNGPANVDDFARDVAIDNSGNVVVTGTSYNGSHGDYYTAKYAAVTGVLLWAQRYDGSTHGHDNAQAVAVDPDGNVVVTGSSSNGNNEDCYTAKYGAADGTLLWAQRHNGPADGNDFARSIAIDDNGNVVIAGSSSNGNDMDYYTAKYAAADGALVWEQHYIGPANGYDAAAAVAVDTSGNIVVTGTSENPQLNYDYYTAKYAAADGSLLWEMRYNGPANGHDGLSGKGSLALGPNGTVAVTGSSDGHFGFDSVWDFATVKYVTHQVLTPVALWLAVTPLGARLRFTGEGSSTYLIQRAANPFGPWNTIAIVSAPPDGAVEYVDTAPLSPSFYRTAAP